MKIEMSFGLTMGEESSDNRLDCCSCCCCCASVCGACPDFCPHTCTGICTCTYLAGNETLCLLRITNGTLIWQAVKRLSTFNMQLDFFFFPKATQLSLQPHNHQIIRVTESHVKYQTPDLLFCWLWGPRLNMSTAGCYERWVMDVSSLYLLKKPNYFVCCSAKWVAAILVYDACPCLWINKCVCVFLSAQQRVNKAHGWFTVRLEDWRPW